MTKTHAVYKVMWQYVSTSFNVVVSAQTATGDWCSRHFAETRDQFSPEIYLL